MEESKILVKLKDNYDYKILSIDFLQDSGGITYIVNGEKQKFFLKIAGKAFQNTIRQSVDIVRYLSRKGFPVPDIIKTKLGMPMLETHDEGQVPFHSRKLDSIHWSSAEFPQLKHLLQ